MSEHEVHGITNGKDTSPFRNILQEGSYWSGDFIKKKDHLYAMPYWVWWIDKFVIVGGKRLDCEEW